MERSSIEATHETRWQFWIDVGGTFTDCLARSPAGELFQSKVLSSGLSKGLCRVTGDDDRSSQFFVEPDAGEQFWKGATFHPQQPSAMGFNGSGSAHADRSQLHSLAELTNAKVTSYETLTGKIELDWGPGFDQNVPASKFAYELDLGIPAPILAIRKLLKLSSSVPIPNCDVHLGTTRGTNALLTRTGARAALVTTKGFGDLLLIGDQARPHLFKLTIKKPEPIFETAIEIDERILADGTVEVAPNADQVRRQLTELESAGIESVAICFMHGFRFPGHEQQVAAIARELGFADVRVSSTVAPLIKILARAETTVLDAYLNPVLGSYLDRIENLLSPTSRLQLMTSAGGLVNRAQFSGKDSVLSGPAGGIVGAARVAEQAGFERALTFDMGGTSSDVGRFDGTIDLEYETRKSDVRIMTPMVAIETVAAGGGSVCWFDGSRLRVGPQSAASDPGPACYGRGGPLAVTDLNLYLGRIAVEHFPFPLDDVAVGKRLQEICDAMNETGFETSPPELAAGFLEIANQNMSAAIGSVSIARGYDPRDYVLVAFGGAGPQHCCAVADSIGMTKILDHPQGSILSAVGIRLADQTLSRVRSVLSPLNKDVHGKLQVAWAEMESEIRRQFAEDGLEFEFSVDLRYSGTEASQSVIASQQMDGQVQENELRESFAEVHQRLFGFNSDRPLEVVAIRAKGRKPGNRLTPTQPTHSNSDCDPDGYQRVWQRNHEGSLVPQTTPVFDRERLSAGDRVRGPALIASSLSTTVVDDGWDARMLSDGQLLLEKPVEASDARHTDSSVDAEKQVDPVRLEIFNSHFSSIARQMGISLQMTSMSVNVKERLDFSCAIFTSTGDLVVNAPHIPVHLGAMAETVRAIIRLNPTVNAGDVFVTNDPFAGGSHLPDVTVITPVFKADKTELIFWVASRSHHSEIGGISPGSMPADATNLAEEGVLIRNFKLVDGRKGIEQFDSLFKLLTAPPYPSRSPHENLADIRAQVAANRTGERDLLALVQQYSQSVVLAYTSYIQDAAESKVRLALTKMKDGTFEFEDSMDNGATIRVKVEKSADRLSIDFSGTDPVLEGNLNANPAIVSSAVIYVMRCLIDEDIPLNEGVMKPVSVSVPECFLNPTSHDDPAQCPAVVGGNVETSQRVVDVLIGAIQQAMPDGLAAASQGTMNNWLMGDDTFGYYETVGGGAGATPNGIGADAVHSHMTNTRLTDPEVLETRYPAILREFSVRHRSGGIGKNSGGNGMIREIEFLKPLTVSLLTNRRRLQPYGILGGQPGASGINQLIRPGRVAEILPNSCELRVQPNDRLRIETPGGGGWGCDGKSN